MSGRFYDKRVWKRMSAAQLSREPLCRPCKAVGRITPATVADHVHAITKGGDPYGALQSMCAACHAEKTARENGRPYKRSRAGFDAQGNPLDRGHHWNGGGNGAEGDTPKEHSAEPTEHRRATRPQTPSTRKNAK